MTDNTTPNDESTDHRTAVRDRYAAIADGDCCGPTCCATHAEENESNKPDTNRGSDEDATDCCEPTCCGDETDEGSVPSSDARSDRSADATTRSLAVGYEESDLASAPDGSNLGLGCGNPVAIAALDRGETVLDLGSGGGFDCFLAAREVGPEGRVIGVDATPAMLDRARENAREGDFENVEFRLGEIEHLPAADASVDAILSNCVLNLSPEKRRVFEEAFRVLRPGGRLSISDPIATDPLPEAVREDEDLVAGCVGGAATRDRLEGWLVDAGFEDVTVSVEGAWDGTLEGEELPLVSASIEARKPEEDG